MPFDEDPGCCDELFCLTPLTEAFDAMWLMRVIGRACGPAP
jgi:hypothetical protein